MHLATLRTVGGSVMFAIPRAILESLDLAADTQVGLSVSAGRLIVDPHPPATLHAGRAARRSGTVDG